MNWRLKLLAGSIVLMAFVLLMHSLGDFFEERNKLYAENAALKVQLVEKESALKHADFIGFEPAVESPPIDYLEDIYAPGEVMYLIGYPGLLDRTAWSAFNGVVDVVEQEGRPCLRVRLAKVKGEYQPSTKTWRGKIK